MLKMFAKMIIENAEALAYATSVVYGTDYKPTFKTENR